MAGYALLAEAFSGDSDETTLGSMIWQEQAMENTFIIILMGKCKYVCANREGLAGPDDPPLQFDDPS